MKLYEEIILISDIYDMTYTDGKTLTITFFRDFVVSLSRLRLFIMNLKSY